MHLEPIDTGLVLWQLGTIKSDGTAGTGAVLTNFNTNGQAWFDATTTPLTAGQLTGGAGTIPTAAWFEIPTEECDALNICFASKVTAVGTQVDVTQSSLITVVAQGMPYYNASIDLWQKPPAVRLATTSTNTDTGFRMFGSSLAIIGTDVSDELESPGFTKSAGTNVMMAQNVLMPRSTGGAAPALEYLHWNFWITRRTTAIAYPVAASNVAASTQFPTISGFRRTWVAILTLNSSTAGATPSLTMYGQLVARRYRATPFYR